VPARKISLLWTLRDSFVETTARMCTRCGAIAWFGDIGKLTQLSNQAKANAEQEPGTPKNETED